MNRLDNESDTAGVVAPPPLIFAGLLAGGLAADTMWRPRALPGAFSKPIGWALIASSFALGGSAAVMMRRAHTQLDPYHPTSAIVTGGPYRFTRNPIYLSFTMLYAGIALVRGALAPFVLLPLALGIVTRGVIEREERYLARKFGATYTDYQARVRRWV